MNVLKLELRNLRRGALLATASICVVIVMMMALFPAMQTESMQKLAGAKMEGLDPALLAAFGLSELVDFTVISNYFGYLLQYISIAVFLFVTGQAVSLLLKEESEGTIEYLCAKPVSRTEIFTQKLLAHLVVTVLMVAVLAFATTLGYVVVSDYSFAQAAKESAILFGGILFVALIFSGLGVFLSTFLQGRGMPGVATALVLGTFIVGILSLVRKELDFLVWLAPMEWVKAQKLLTQGLLWQEWVIGIGIIVLGTWFSLLRYQRRDLLI